VTHAILKLNRYPVWTGTRAEYTARLSTSETCRTAPWYGLRAGPGNESRSNDQMNGIPPN